MKRNMLINVNNRPDVCPLCGGNIVDIIYGEPNQGNMTNPEWGCVKCGRKFKLVK